MNKTYTVYNFDYYDDSIEEHNSAFSVLSKKSKEDAQDSDDCSECWYSGTSQMKIEDILKYIWSKEDVDSFVEEYHECLNKIFTIYDESKWGEVGRINHIKYCPLQEKRNDLIKQLIKE